MDDFSFANVFGDGMVLQRGKQFAVWGSGPEGAEVSVSLGDDRCTARVSKGKWLCNLPPQKAGMGFTLQASCGEKVILCRNVMIGEVFLAGGQSNMEFQMRYEAHWVEAQKLERNPMIRMYNCPRFAFAGQVRDQQECGFWFDDSDVAWERFSALGYWFARFLQPQLGVPVGIVGCNWGGTSASAWIPVEDLKEAHLKVYLEDYYQTIRRCTLEDLEQRSLEGWAFLETPAHKAEVSRVMRGMSLAQQLEHIRNYSHVPSIPMGPYNKNRPGGLYQYMFQQVVPFAFKAVLWYQGENDEHHAALYALLFETLIRRWRADLLQSDLPFFFVQLAYFERWMELDGRNFPAVREQQEIASRTVKNCYMTTALDLGMRYDIHPKEKREVGRRLNDLVLKQLYDK